ncbi:tetratricopeptide repeat protein [candidate division KSB1 bacterium]|nr:tetratricopeptide repeat protein [candidate division KSB1 bacterium]
MKALSSPPKKVSLSLALLSVFFLLLIIFTVSGNEGPQGPRIMGLNEQGTTSEEAYGWLVKANRVKGSNPGQAVEFLQKAVALDPDYHAAHYYLGKLYLKQGNLTGATDELEMALKLNPEFPDQYRELGRIYQKTGEIEKAVRVYKSALTHGFSSGIFNDLLSLYREGDQIERAAEECQAVLRSDPGNKDAHLNLALIYAIRGRYAGALEELKRVVPLGEYYHPGGDLYGGSFYFNEGLYRAAVDLYQQALGAAGEDYTVHYGLGLLYFYKGDDDLAAEELEGAVEIGPPDAELHFTLALTYVRKKQFDRVIQEYKQALRIDPNLTAAHRNLGSIYHRRGRLEEAIAEYRRVTEIDPADGNAYLTLGDIYNYQLSNFGRAASEYRKAIVLWQERGVEEYYLGYAQLGKAYANLGYASMQQGKLDEAEAAYQKAVALSPGEALYHYSLADVYSKSGKLDEAISEFQQAIDLSPESPHYHFSLGYAYAQKKRLEEAMAEYQRAAELNPVIPYYHFSLAYIYSQLKMPEKAAEEYQKAIALDPRDADSHYNLALIYTFAGDDKERAIAQLNKYLEVARNQPAEAGWVEKAERILKNIRGELAKEEFPEKIKGLAVGTGPLGLMAAFLAAEADYAKGNDLFVEGMNQTKVIYKRRFLFTKPRVSYEISPEVYEAGEYFQKFLNEVTELDCPDPETRRVKELFLRAGQERLNSIELFFREGFKKEQEYRDEIEKGIAKVKIADSYLVDGLTVLMFSMEKFPEAFNEYDLEQIQFSINYYSGMYARKK